MEKKRIELDPEEREWEYDGDGRKIYKVEAGYSQKTVWEEFVKHGMYHEKMDNGVGLKRKSKYVDCDE
jgi:hypothetical protein|tara:strand:+ start:979 stop:1182 length:204 start_codon:yes stop_codon:yes gene_type:complete